jgi:hypothetical protein
LPLFSNGEAEQHFSTQPKPPAAPQWNQKGSRGPNLVSEGNEQQIPPQREKREEGAGEEGRRRRVNSHDQSLDAEFQVYFPIDGSKSEHPGDRVAKPSFVGMPIEFLLAADALAFGGLKQGKMFDSLDRQRRCLGCHLAQWLT